MQPNVEQGNQSTLKTIKAVLEGFPVKKPATAKDKKAAEEKKKKDEEDAAAQKLIPKTLTNDESLSKAEGWHNSVNVGRKFAVGTVASSKYD